MLEAKLDSVQSSLERLEVMIKANTETRIYQDAFKAGEKSGAKKFMFFIDTVSRVIGVCVVLGFLYAAGSAVGVAEFFTKLVVNSFK